MRAADGKNRLTDVADTEQLLRIIQSIPSKNAEPFKAWLALVGRERIEETIDPERAIDRALETYLKKGYSEEWVHQRLLAIRIPPACHGYCNGRGTAAGEDGGEHGWETSRIATTEESSAAGGRRNSISRVNANDRTL